MEFKQGEMYKVVLAYSMSDDLFTYPITLIGKCLLSNEKYVTLLNPLTNVVQGFKLSQVSTAEPYEASTASVKPETTSVAGKSSVPSVAKGTTDAPTTKAPPKPSIVAGLGESIKHSYFTRSKGTIDTTAPRTVRLGIRAPVEDESKKSEVSILRTNIQPMLEKSLTTNPNAFEGELNKALKELYDVMVLKCPKSEKTKPKSNVIPIVPSETLCIPYERGNKEDLKSQIGVSTCPPGRHMYILTLTEFIHRDTFEESKSIPTVLFLYTSPTSVATYQLC